MAWEFHPCVPDESRSSHGGRRSEDLEQDSSFGIPFVSFYAFIRCRHDVRLYLVDSMNSNSNFL